MPVSRLNDRFLRVDGAQVAPPNTFAGLTRLTRRRYRYEAAAQDARGLGGCHDGHGYHGSEGRRARTSRKFLQRRDFLGYRRHDVFQKHTRVFYIADDMAKRGRAMILPRSRFSLCDAHMPTMARRRWLKTLIQSGRCHGRIFRAYFLVKQASKILEK